MKFFAANMVCICLNLVKPETKLNKSLLYQLSDSATFISEISAALLKILCKTIISKKKMFLFWIVYIVIDHQNGTFNKAHMKSQTAVFNNLSTLFRKHFVNLMYSKTLRFKTTLKFKLRALSQLCVS